MKKRLISILLITALMISLIMCASFSSAAAELYGDVDGDEGAPY